jgi:hypothetical protein
MFNAFKLTKQLEEVGFSREQAEIQIQVITEIIEGDLATKQDLNMLGSNLRNEMQQLEHRLTIKLGTLLIIGFTTLATLMKFWIIP